MISPHLPPLPSYADLPPRYTITTEPSPEYPIARLTLKTGGGKSRVFVVEKIACDNYKVSPVSSQEELINFIKFYTNDSRHESIAEKNKIKNSYLPFHHYQETTQYNCLKNLPDGRYQFAKITLSTNPKQISRNFLREKLEHPKIEIYSLAKCNGDTVYIFENQNDINFKKLKEDLKNEYLEEERQKQMAINGF